METFSCVACPECNGKELTVTHNDKQKFGLCHTFELECAICKWQKRFHTSRHIHSDSERLAPRSGRRPFEVNNRAIIAFREIGKGFSGMEKFCGLMNMMPPMAKTTFSDKNADIHDVYMSVCQKSMKEAALESQKAVEKSINEDSVSDIDVSLDGTWQRRGYASMNGVVTAISHVNGKCVDAQVLSKDCRACKTWERKKESNKNAYEQFKVHHSCPINHKGSAGSMESKAAVEIFSRSVAVNRLRYKTYIGDGDSSAFQSVVDSNPYPGLIPKKGECIGHVQKRVGGRLRKLKSNFKGKLNDGKPLGGRGRLTEKLINTLQNAMGMAIRQNVGSVYAMKKSVGALLYHYSENEDLEKRHHFCPRGPNSWCKFQSDKSTGKNSYREKIGIPLAIHEKIKPIFQDLSSDALLSKCLHGKTQNVNESLNQVIWKRCPKDIYVERFTLETGVASAIINFNDGLSGVINVFNMLCMEPGAYSVRYCNDCDEHRIKTANRKDTPEMKQRRKQLRAIKKGYIDKDTENEEVAYKSGDF
eukprot:Seg418.7 transcript_id=Seg418.7/GoldUCD/mRNA.D3Y31 product="hypothetical protein" protein_id=Seg418.7/GoldUCD/D3Y31